MEIRLDSLLVSKGFVTSRERAKELIASGKIYVDGQNKTKPSFKADEDALIEIRGEILKYVSRGGLKLKKAIECFDLNIKDSICADIGASTGGFTDCMLINGAKRVYAVDVGHDQLALKLRNDNRVINLEGENIRYLSKDKIPDNLDFISIDVSFISLSLVLPVVREFLTQNGIIVALIKPQFEAGKSNVGKKGVVKSKDAHIMVLEKITAFADSIGLFVDGLTFSPIKGPEGNIEYLVKLSGNKTDYNYDIKNIVNLAFGKSI